MPASTAPVTRARWSRARPVDETFLATAPLVVSDVMEIPRPAAAVWADLTADDTLHWITALSSVTWTSPRPFGVGTTRQVKLPGGVVINERYFRWEEGRRKSFYVEATSAPAFRAMAEDYLVEPTGEASCRFSWTIAAESPPLLRAATPVNRLVFRRLFAETRGHYGIG